MQNERLVAIPVQRGGQVLMRDLRDLIEATDDRPETDFVQVLAGELRYEVTT
jgi:hypothetical protein